MAEEKALANPWTEGTRIYGRAGSKHADVFGVATGHTRQCTMEGCRGIRVRIVWPDGKATLPCTRGLGPGPTEGTFQIE